MSFSLQTAIQSDNISAVTSLITPIGQNLNTSSSQTIAPNEGGIAYNTTDNKLYVGNGTAWSLVSGGGTGVAGNTGYSGPTGLGPSGVTGQSGSSGPTGLGATGLGATGMSGSSGQTGNSGTSGPT